MKLLTMMLEAFLIAFYPPFLSGLYLLLIALSALYCVRASFRVRSINELHSSLLTSGTQITTIAVIRGKLVGVGEEVKSENGDEKMA